MEMFPVLALIVTQDLIQPYWISLWCNVVLESPRVTLFGHYLLGTDTLDSAHIVHEVQTRDRKGEMQCIRALIDGSRKSNFMALRLYTWLRILYEMAHITSIALAERVMKQVNNTWKTQVTVQYLEYLVPVNATDVVILSMPAYDLVLGVNWLPIKHADIERTRCRLSSVGSPNTLWVKEMTPMTMAVSLMVSEANTDMLLGWGLDIQTVGAASFNDILARDQVVAALVLCIVGFTVLLGVTLELVTLASGGNKTLALTARSREQRRELR